ncbi:MFS transporter [Mycolicibacterium goodii]|uniref:MFS transporter n=1 Tax=Mycolicibacterium goodii TaxID=134601 RepID=UPI001BDCF0E0|nr:MFS transporter [Mycolicibacterium goodii]MBU8828917.1 MFS transporter [Mycolicibacterium goodii]
MASIRKSAVASAAAPVASHAPDPRLMRKAITASAIGNATEWYDYGVYAAASFYLTQAFFPGELGAIGTMLGFAVSFVLRPLGGLVWGPLGDRMGRKSVLAMTIILMAAATALIGLLPTHAAVGIWAPILLILLRVIQGFSTGGEYGGAATFMAEYSPDDKRGRYGSFLEFGTLAGLSAGTALVLLLEVALSNEQMLAWGWRIPFLVALPLGLIGLYMRSQLEDTPVFKELEQRGEIVGGAWSRLIDLGRGYWQPLLVLFGLVIAVNGILYVFLFYAPTYLQSAIGLTPAAGSTVILVAQLAMMVMVPFFGRWSDVTGRKPMWWGSLIGIFILAVPLYWLMGQGFVGAIIGFVVFGLLFVPQPATIASTFPAMFPTQVRFAGMAISYNVATAVFGGTAPLLNEAVIGATGWTLFPAFFMMGACVIGMIALSFLKETAGASLRGTGIPQR